MRRTSQLAALAAAVVAVLALGAIGGHRRRAPARPSKVESTVTLGATRLPGQGQGRELELRRRTDRRPQAEGQSASSAASMSKPNGNWRADLEELNENIKIPAKVFAEVKPSTQATAGPIYKCLGAVSKTVEIAGG